VLLVVLALTVLYVGFNFAEVVWKSRQDEAQPSQAIVVLGAAQYDGTPSPVFEARLDHALDLYREGLAPVIVVTGGRQEGDRFTEATAGANYLIAQGVPDEDIRREVDAHNSWESLAAVARILDDEGIDDVLLVSDPYHSYRLDAIAGELGLNAHVSPTRSSPQSLFGQFKAMARETAAVSVGRFVGYRRLVNIDDQVGRLRDGVATG
jgi:uncharacterized SAM-binding protein YcdF (DUF218 family)